MKKLQKVTSKNKEASYENQKGITPGPGIEPRNP